MSCGIDTLRLTAEEALGLLERGDVSPRELWDAYRDAIAARDGELHCYLRTLEEPEGDGVPIALKDVIGTKGITTTAGSRILERYVPVYDSTVAARCKQHGLRTLGKTNTDEFAMGSSTENSAYGPTRNPWDPSRVPGGSGGGSAAAVAAGLAPWALGSDTGGSIQLPSAFCGNYGLPCYYLIAPAEASSNLARYDGVRYGLRVDGADFREMVMRTRHDGFGDEPKRRIMLGTYALSSGYYDAYYASAQKVRTVIKREHDELFERFDVLLSPTCATTAFPVGAKTQDPLAMYLTDVLTIPSNMAGLPSLSIPCGLSDGLPVGLQLIGPQFAENTLFRAGHALERAIGFDPVPERLK